MPQPVQSFWVSVTRPRDLLEITFQFRNVDLVMPQGNKPGRVASVGGSRLVVYFNSQHMAEQAIFETAAGFEPTQEEIDAMKETDPGRDLKKEYEQAKQNPETPPNPGGIQAIFSGPSRLVFDIPRGMEIPYTLTGLLEALKQLPLVVSPLMTYELPGCNPLYLINPTLRPPAPKIVKPGERFTAIEAPYRLIMSPDDKASWDHSSGLISHDGRTELWHTHLRPDAGGELPKMRAIWTPDFRPNEHVSHEDKPFRMSLDAHDRNELVHLTSNWYLTRGNTGYVPEPVETDQLMLSTLGAWLKVYGDWPVTQGIKFSASGESIMTVEEWRHEAAMGRDQYVRVVYAGFLYPFGHRASLVKITERKFLYQEDPPGYVAYLFQRMFIIVRQRVRRYTHRQIPFRRIIVKTRLTPNLDPPANSQISEPNTVWPKGSGQEAFWPVVTEPGGKVYFRFKMSGQDWEGRMLEFTSPAVFVSLDTDSQEAKRNKVFEAYDKASLEKEDRRRRPFNGQMVAFAPPSQPKKGDTSLSTRALTFGVLKRDDGPAPHFLPSMTAAEVEIPAVARLLGNSKPVEIAFEESYAKASAQKPELSTIGNDGEVFAKLRGDPADLKFQVDKGGGLVAPDIKISGLSRSLGPVDITPYNFAKADETADMRSMVDGAFKAGEIFADKVKLLGGISLKDIIAEVDSFGHASQVAGQIPGLNSVVVNENGVDIARTTYKYQLGKSDLQETDLFLPEDETKFSIVSVVDTPLNGDPGAFELAGYLTDFSVVLVPEEGKQFVKIIFKQLSFKAVKDKKPDVSVDLKGVEFLGPLDFVNTLSDVIPLDGFSDPPNLAITPSGIDVGYSLGIPVVGVGIFSLQNISLTAGAFLPLISDKALNFHFAFCERHQPFLLTVSLFGGGGFFGLDLGLGDVKMVEAALEFGAAAAINLGVAAGTLSFMGGVYYQKAGDSFELTGYFRANGSLSVLGLITVSVEFYLGLTYSSKTSPHHAGAVWGQAKLTVKIEIAFFSKSVGITMEREFAGADPAFNDLVAPGDWKLYCEAFADY